MPTLDGLPSASKIITFTDPKASVLKLAYSLFGTNAPGEANTLAVTAATDQVKTMGDGGSNPGLGAYSWQQLVATAEANFARQHRWDAFYQKLMANLCGSLDTVVRNNLPASWQFTTTATQGHPFDFWLTYLNACNAGTPTTPAAAGTLAATINSNGALPSVSSGNAARVLHCLVGASDYLTSLPSAEATQVALTGSQNAYTYTISGTVPSGVTKVRLFRGYAGGASGGPYYWDQDVAVTAGSAYPAMTLLNADAALLTTVNPPSWLSCLMVPEFAILFALAFSTNGAAQSSLGIAGPPQFAQGGMLSPGNVAVPVATSFTGLGNTVGDCILGAGTITAANTLTWTVGSIQTTNVPTRNIQGFAGAFNVSMRVTSALNGTCTPTLTYSYLDAAHGQTVQSTTIAGTAFSGTTLGSTSTFSIPAGRLVTAITGCTISGTATSGAIEADAVSIRSY